MQKIIWIAMCVGWGITTAVIGIPITDWHWWVLSAFFWSAYVLGAFYSSKS